MSENNTYKFVLYMAKLKRIRFEAVDRSSENVTCFYPKFQALSLKFKVFFFSLRGIRILLKI